MLESAIQARIVNYLRGRADTAFVVKLNDSFTSGIPDIHFIWNGRPCYLEVKSKTGKVSPIQAAVMKEISAAGGLAAVVRSMDDVRDFFLMFET